MTEMTIISVTPAGQFKLGCSGQLAPNVTAKVSSANAQLHALTKTTPCRPQKNCADLFLLQLRQISTNLDNF